MKERWLPVVSYEGEYEVSDKGRVKSLARNIPRSDGYPHLLKERILKPTPDSQGRPSVGLHRASQRKMFRIASLVLTAFIGPCPAGLEACHRDDNNANNALGNLRWDTRASNIADRYRNGRDGQQKRRMTMQRKGVK